MTTAGPSSSAAVQEFKIRVPKNVKKKYHVMRFNATLNVDFAKWTHVKMERENNIKEFKGLDEEMPKFGAGSEYGRDVREEARRKKFGIISRKYKPEDQPWILKVGGKTGKKFKGIREGGVSENAAYYVFTHAADGAIDAYPLQEWYNFQPIQRYKALSAEEAEQEFGRRNKVMNYFSLMFRKRMRGDEGVDEAEDPDEKKTKGAKAKKDLKISDMDEWIESGEDSSESEAGEKEDSDSGNKKKKDKKVAANKKKKKKVEDEAFEESDDGDEEGRERDYISDSSDSESDHETKANKELKGVAEEDALRKLLTSDEDSDEEAEQKQESEQEDEPTKEGEERASKLTKKKRKNEEKKDSSSELSSDSDTDPENSSSKKPKKSKKEDKNGVASGASAPGSASTSRAGSPAPQGVGSAASSAHGGPPTKRAKLDPAYVECGVTEEAVRRYLARKPMTTTELLTKFKSKRTGVSSERLVETMTQILKRINPVKQNINSKMYLSIKQT
ncbi:general transcription factor IIF subunit 1 isoform X2 [Achroia grisella]|uniref:general transcription factor IIF subunit 1 isoform X2 n=1 Tax=Achroia grisella TaxID=688607 RepID=UPI0027D30718|nr:general transcription factor IIF subunit 1 isoform X2 [Achroia grisella]